MLNFKGLAIGIALATVTTVTVMHLSDDSSPVKTTQKPSKQSYYLNKGQNLNEAQREIASDDESLRIIKTVRKAVNKPLNKAAVSKGSFKTSGGKKVKRTPAKAKSIAETFNSYNNLETSQKNKKENKVVYGIGGTSISSTSTSNNTSETSESSNGRKTEITPSIPPTIKGKVPALSGLITSHFQIIDQAYAAATTCTNAKIQLFDATTMTVLSDNPIGLDDITQETTFEFDPNALELDLDSPTKYLLRTTGCDQTYERIVTSFFTLQDLSPTSTLISKIFKSAITVNPEDLDGKKLENVIEEVQKTITHSDDPENAYTELNTNPTAQTMFQDTFNGEDHTKLADAAPDIKTINIPASMAEKVSSIFSVTSEHWNTSYVTAYQWKLDGVTQSNGNSWTYTPTANAKRSVNIQLLVGSKEVNPSNDVDTTLPHHVFNYTISISDDFPTIAPNISLNAGVTNPTTTRDINLDLDTGASSGPTYVNCESFSAMAVTENSDVPAAGDFTINCTNAITQIVPVHLFTPSDGSIDVNIWARDINGTISPKKTVSIVLDTAGPVFNITAPSAFYRADTSNTFSWTVSDANLNSANNLTVELYDGTSWTNLVNKTVVDGLNTNTPFSQSYTLPNLQVANAKIRLSLTDTAGNNTTTESPIFAIRKPNLAVLPLTYNWGSTPNNTNGSNNTFVISNSGDAGTKNCTLPTLSGANAAEFEITTDSCGTSVLNPASNCNIIIRPKPTSKGIKNATLNWACDLDTISSTLTYTSANNLPVVGVNTAETTNEDTALNFTVSSATDLDSDPLVYSIVTAPSNGVITNCLANNNDLTCTYTPNANYYGVDSFTFKANDGTSDSAGVTTVNITVNSVNDRPVIGANQNFITNEDTLVSFTLNSATDVDIPVQTLSYKVITAPTNGVLSNCINTGAYLTDRTCDYTPNADFNGADSFTYEAFDSVTNSVTTATVNITVNGVNDAPTLAAGQIETIAEDNVLNFTLNAGADIDGDTLSYIVVSTSTNGVLSCTGGTSRNCTYTPNLNFNGADSFTYKVNDGALDSPTRTVNITVTAVNDAPTLAATQTVSTNEDTILNFTLNAGADVDGDTLNYVKLTDPATGTLSCAGGTSRNCTYTPVADDNGSYTFTYRVTDSALNSTTATVTINVTAQNDAPVMVGDQAVATNEDTTLAITLSGASDIDIPAQTLQYKLITTPTNGALANCITTGAYNTDITCDYTPSLNFNGVDSFTYRANDTLTDSATDSTVTITVNAVNDAPTLAATQAVSTNEDTPLTFNLTAGTDVEGSTLSYIKVSNSTNGTITCVGGTSRSCTYTPNANFNGADSFTYKVNDGSLDSATATVNITVNPINDAPVVAANQNIAITEDTATAFTIDSATDIDIPAQTLQYRVVTAPTNGVLSGCITAGAYSTDRTCTYTPNANFNGSDTLVYKAYDGVTDSATNATITFTISAVNDAPTLAATQAVSVTEDTAKAFNLTTGSDVDGDTLSYIIVANPTNGALSCTGGTSTACTYTPNANYNGVDTFTYKVNDGALDSTTNTVTLTISAVNDAPTLAATQSVSVTEDTAKVFDLTAGADVDGDTLNYVVVTNPASGVLSCTGGTSRSCTYTPAANVNGAYTFTYRVNDGSLNSTINTVTLNIAAVNDAPTAVATQNITTDEDVALNFNLTAGSDIEGDTLSYIVVTNPSNGAISCTGGTSRACTYTPNANFNGSDSFSYKVNDGALDSASNTIVSITVNAVNDAPVMAANQTFNTDDNVNLNITLSNATDIDGDALTYKIVTAPSNGVLSNCITTGVYGTDLTCTYDANTNFNGVDTFTFIANDSTVDAATVETVTINVTDKTVPNAPAVNLAHSIYRNTTSVSLTATSCADTPFIFVNEGAQPGSGAAGWQACSTGAGALSYTLATTTQGNHNLKVWAKDAYNNVSTASTNLTVIYDTVNPSIAVTNPGIQKGGQTVSIGWTLTEANIDATKYYTIEYWNGSAWANVSTTKPATSGPHTTAAFTTNWVVPTLNRTDIKLRVAIADLAGNTASAESTTFEIDSIAPSVAISSPAANSYHQTALTLTGTCETGVNVDLSGDIPANFSTACTAGTFSQLVNLSSGDGNKTITATQVDAAGNSAAVSRTFIRDEVAPAIAKTAGVSPDFTRNNQPNAWSGTCEGNYTISVTGDETTSFACTAGTWSWTPSAKTVDGTYTYNLTQTDGAGNTSTPLSLSWERDATPPVFTATAPVSIATGATGNVTNNQDNVTLSGTCEGSNTINISGSQTAAISCSSSSWTWTTTNFTTDATRSFTLTQSDLAGNTAALTLSWVRDTSGPALAITDSTIKSNQDTVTFAGTCEIGLTINVTGTETSSTTCATGTWTWTSTSNTTDATRSYNFEQAFTVSPFNSTSVSGQWIRETDLPTISVLSSTASNPTKSANIPITMTATSQNPSVNLSHICLKTDVTTTPVASDLCWVEVNGPAVGLPLAQTLNMTGQYFHTLGWVANTTFTVYSWVKDEAGNISTLTNAGVGTFGTDKLDRLYDPGVPPTVFDVVAANDPLAPNPPTRAQSSSPAGSDLYVKWKASDNVALPSGAISLFYSQDEINFTQVSGASALDHGTNYGCTGLTLAANEGCFKWTGGSPLSTSYKIRVKVTDSTSISAQSISNPINSDTIKIIAGNTESGLGGSAVSAMFFTRKSGSESDPGTLVVTNDGRIYFADYKRGILTVDPSDGKQKIFIPQTGTSSGDGGPATNATLNYAVKIALDFQNRLLILDRNRIRRVDLNLANPTIETIIGGGSSTADTIANPLDVQFYSHSTNSWYSRSMVFFATPNGDIYFHSDRGWRDYSSADPYRIRIYRAATNSIESKKVSGAGDGLSGGYNLSDCGNGLPGLAYNPGTSQLTGAYIQTLRDDHYPVCNNADWRFTKAFLNPDTFVSTGPHNDSYRYYRYFSVTGMNGQQYQIIDRNYVMRNNWDGTYTKVLGSGTRGHCNDGTANLSCNMDIQDIFVTSTGKIYFLDGGQIRTIDGDGNVVTLFGQNAGYGDGVNALNARFDKINTLSRLDNGKIVVADYNTYYFKEFTIEGNIDIIAGTGNYAYQNHTTDVKSQGFYDGTWWAANKATGDIYARDHYNGGIAKIDRATNKWVQVVGTGATAYWSADGMTGTNVRGGGSGNQDHALVVGFDNNQLLATRMKYNSPDKHWEDFMIKSYDKATTYTQAHLAGTNDPANTYTGGYNGICASGSTAATCKIPYWDSFGLNFWWDSANNRWITAGRYRIERQVWSITPGGNMTKLATTARNIDESALWRNESGTDVLYYCYGGRIYKHNITTDTDQGALSWPITNLYCRGYKMDYNPTNNSIIFPFEQNGLYGVGEYFLP
jgi:VCBS repeat-containing protein